MTVIVPMDPTDVRTVQEAAALLMRGFAVSAPEAWPDLTAALEEVYEALEPAKITLIARAGDGSVAGWISGRHDYARVWELHPLVVDPAHQGQGIGRALVGELETRVAARGALTLRLGTDDETGMTSLSGVNLYPDVWQHIRQIRNLKRHPYSFYEKCGFVIVGVVPDANGLGKPDIQMAKPLRGAL